MGINSDSETVSLVAWVGFILSMVGTVTSVVGHFVLRAGEVDKCDEKKRKK